MNPKVAIIGSGFGMYCLLPAFSNASECEVVSICGKNSERMSNFCKKFNVKQYIDWKEMIHKEKPDAIAVAVIPKYQFEIIKFALENKIAVFAEKPLTTNYHTSLELYELAKKFNLPNMIDFEFTEIPEWIEAKNIIETEKIGKILSVELNWTFLSHDLANGIKSWKTNIEKGGGALSLVFSHSFYYLEYFLGKIKNIDCSLSSSKISLNHGDTTIDMKLLFENGCNGNIHVDISDSKNQKHIIKFLGSNGELILENISHDFLDNFKLKLQQNNEIQKILYVQKLNFLNDVNEDPRIKFVANLTNKFINWCNTGIPAKPNFQDGLRVEKLIEIARTSNHNK
jgi:predicted dehydrogenase